MGRTRRVSGWLALALLLVFAPAAQGTLFLAADSTTNDGYVRLGVIGSASLTDVHVGEVVGGTYEEIKALMLLPYGVSDESGELGREDVPQAARWRCDRRSRNFVAYGTDTQGAIERSNVFSVDTPSCANRLRLDVPVQVGSGRSVPIELKDTFAQGNVGGKLCRKLAGRPARCTDLRVPSGRKQTATSLALPRDGHWRISLRSPVQTIQRVVAVGVKPRPQDLSFLPNILATGDSLMQGLDAILDDRLSGEAQVDKDVHIGSGLSKPVIVDWAKLPTRQVREFQPKATLLFLGTNDGQPIQNAQGTFVACCDEPWIAEYTILARRAMKTYLQNGSGRVYWLKIPAARDDRRVELIAAVNQALDRAAKGLKGASVLDMSAVFTPGGVYRDTMTYKGQVVRVRQQDGIHLSNAGARIAADVVVDQLRRDGVL
jgi:lysophospholipase L1-like esterase